MRGEVECQVKSSEQEKWFDFKRVFDCVRLVKDVQNQIMVCTDQKGKLH